MTNVNTMSKGNYIFDNIFYASLFLLSFTLSFEKVPGVSLIASFSLLMVLLVSLITLGILFTVRHRRNYLSLVVNVGTPYSIYFLIAFGHRLKPWMAILCATLVILLSAAYLWIMLSARKQHVIKKCAAKSLLGLRTITSLGLIMLCTMLLLNPGGTVDNANVYASGEADAEMLLEKWTIADNIETVIKFYPDEFPTLTRYEKLEALRVIANIERSYLGIPHELRVVITELEEGTAGCYSDDDHTIMLNLKDFDTASPQSLLSILCHEAYHAYQHRLCDMYDSLSVMQRELLLFDEVAEYKSEFADYTSGHDEYWAYYWQRCEVEARKYSEEAVQDYYDRMEDYFFYICEP